MVDSQQVHGTAEPPDTPEADERRKVAARCSECGTIYPAWVLPDDSIRPIGPADGCRCGVSAFRVIPRTSYGESSVSYEEGG